MQTVEDPVADQTADFAELKQQLDLADADIMLVNKRLDEAQGMYIQLVSKCFKRSMMLVSITSCDCRWSCCRGDPSVGLARAKEQARISDAAALKALEELRAE